MNGGPGQGNTGDPLNEAYSPSDEALVRHPARSLCLPFSDLKQLRLSDNFFSRRCIMNWDQITGEWKQLKGKVKEKWGKLTDDDLTTIAGKREYLAGLLQERYGYAKDQAEKELNEFSDKLKL